MNFNNQKSLILIGDTHGSHSFLRNKFQEIQNALFIHVGDIGVGFHEVLLEDAVFSTLNDILIENNSQFVGIRGNHDDPKKFDGEYSKRWSNFHLVPDYTHFIFQDKKIQLIGGGISLDRSARTEGIDYWRDEIIKYFPEKIIKSDILITHSAPSYCNPVGFNDFCLNWFKHDKSLELELINEREQLKNLVDLSECKIHCYGHFHLSSSERINGRKHICLDIDEIKELI